MTSNIPRLEVTEEAEPLFPRGKGGKVIVAIGDAGFTGNPTKVYEFSSYAVAREDHLENGDAIGEEPVSWDTNPLLKAVRDIFDEGAIRSPLHKIGIEKVYAINVGSAPSAQDYADALEATEELFDVKIELYVGLSDVTILETIEARLATLASEGIYRVGIGTVADEADKATMMLMTDDGETHFVQNSRLYIHTDRNMQATFAGKVACTPYYQNPAFGSYRSKTVDDLTVWSKPDRDDLLGAGLIVDRRSYKSKEFIEPELDVATSFASIPQPDDCRMHVRLNVDHHWEQTDDMTMAFLKGNNTEAVRGIIEETARGYFQKEVDAGNLIPRKTAPVDPGFMFELEYSTSNPNQVIRTRKCRPVPDIELITDRSIIQMPIGGG